MVNLPVLQELLNRGRKEKLVILKMCCYSGINFVLIVQNEDENNIEFTDSVKNTFVSLMESDYFFGDVIEIMERKGIYIADHFLLERIMFVVFKKEL